jgi:lipopolysaccharide/colanic/teichoic acid biosynthesis glycosyltransferase
VLRRHSTALRLSLVAADAASAVLLFVLVNVFRFGSGWREAWANAGVDPAPLAALYAIAWTTTLWLLGLYRLRARWSWRREWMDVLRGMLLLAVISLAVLFVAKLPNVSRVFLAELFIAQALATIASRLVVRRLYARVRARGYNASFILIVGDGPPARAFAERLSAHAQFGIRVAGYVRDPALGAPALGAPAPIPPGSKVATTARHETTLDLPDAWSVITSSPRVLGDLDDLPAILHGMVVDEVAICLPPESLAFLEPIARMCEDEGKVVRIPLGETGISLKGGTEDNLDGIRVLSLTRGPDHTVAMIAKRVLDIVGSVVALVVLSPLLVLAAIAVVIDDGRPVLYRQERVGRNGRPFKVVKFRSMTRDAEARLAELEARNEIKGHAFKVTDDPRVTRVGRTLRKTSIDELPQLWNVLLGQMSLVGPRPPLPAEVASYDIWHRRRLMMKPGITGLWQVSARREVDFDQWVRLDIDYIDRWSLALDIKIIMRTVPALFQGR